MPFFNSNTKPSKPKDEPVLSKLNGKKKALFIGLNYSSSAVQLNGCIAAAKTMRTLALESYGFEEKDTKFLRDDQPDALPTKKGILQGISWLLDGAQVNDSLLFYYSGHGKSIPDENGDEWDTFDEALWPSDYEKSGFLLDDDLYDVMIKKVPAGCRLTMFIDCCHSGTIMDLPYEYDEHGNPSAQVYKPRIDKAMEMALKWEYEAKLEEWKNRPSHCFLKPKPKLEKPVAQTKPGTKKFNSKITKAKKETPKDIVLFSSCLDEESSNGTDEPGVGQIGLFTHVLSSYLSASPQDRSFQNIIDHLYTEIKKKVPNQHPQVLACYSVDFSKLLGM